MSENATNFRGIAQFQASNAGHEYADLITARFEGAKAAGLTGFAPLGHHTNTPSSRFGG